jgi:hypothetical protein
MTFKATKMTKSYKKETEVSEAVPTMSPCVWKISDPPEVSALQTTGTRESSYKIAKNDQMGEIEGLKLLYAMTEADAAKLKAYTSKLESQMVIFPQKLEPDSQHTVKAASGQ